MIQVFSSPERTKIIESIIDKFEALNPGVEIELISPPYETAVSKVNLMMSTEQPLDIVEVSDWLLSGLVSMGKLENLEHYIANSEQAKYWIDGVVEAARTVGDTAYLMPNAVYVKTVFYRPDILAKYNIIGAPRSMGEMMAVCQYLTNGKDQYGFTYRGVDPVNFMDLVLTSFFDDIDPLCMYKTKSGKIIFEDSRALAGLNFYLDLYRKASPKDSISWGFDEQVNAFVSGLTPILFQDPDTTGLLNNLLKNGVYKTAPLPLGPGGKAYPTFGFAGWGIPTYSENKDIAWKFIEFFNLPENSAFFCKEYGALPVDSRVYETNEYFSSDIFYGWAVMFANPDIYQITAYPIDNEAWGEWFRFQGDIQERLLLNKMTPEKALQEFTQFWKDAGI
jgi:multiple sugar transport system substrate-binding protein